MARNAALPGDTYCIYSTLYYVVLQYIYIYTLAEYVRVCTDTYLAGRDIACNAALPGDVHIVDVYYIRCICTYCTMWSHTVHV
jgi:hypothetical protein